MNAPALLVLPLLFSAGAAPGQEPLPLEERAEHAWAENEGVRLHYATLGDPEGQIVLLLHGFPDYWYTWRRQIEALAEAGFRAAAMDLRGYNRSDAPDGVERYAMPLLVADALAVIRAAGRERAIVVGHDWGAAIAWQLAMSSPETVSRLVILSVPHPAGFARELFGNEDQRRDSQYARDFQEPDSHERLSAEGLASWVRPADRERYVAAFRRSSFEAMMNYYRASYPRTDPSKPAGPAPVPAPSWPRIACPVLVIHGQQDRALNVRGHDGTWEWIDAPSTLLVIPGAGHFVHHDEPELVTGTILDWLRR